MNAIRELLPEPRRGSVTRGRIGVQVSPVTRELVEPLGLKDPSGALVRSVDRDGPAAAAGIQPGGVIVRYNCKPIAASNELTALVSRSAPGTTVPIDVIRKGREATRLRLAP